MYTLKNNIENFDAEVWKVMQEEAKRQENHIELIASENFTSPRILEAQGSVLTNKYAEGYPGKRYYGGCQYVDQIEAIAIERAKKVFGAHYVNVQPHSGSSANASVFMALMNPGDTFLGMSLSQGGHLTHGANVSFSGKMYNPVQYGLHADTGKVNYDEVAKLAQEHKPKMIIAGFSAYSRIMDWQIFRDIADSVGAYLFVDMAHIAGLVAAGLHSNPVPIADVVATTTHKTLRGPRGGMILAKENPAIEKKISSAVFPGAQGGPLLHVIAGKAIALKEAMSEEFKNYQIQVISNARKMAEVFQDRGYSILSGGTDNHLFLLDLSKKDITGQEADLAFGIANITVNKNSVPNDPRPPFVTSGIRIGTPAMTTRGFKEKEAKLIADWMCDILDDHKNESVIADVKAKVVQLCHEFPLYEKNKHL